MDLLLRLVLLQHEELAVREAPDHRFGEERVALGFEAVEVEEPLADAQETTLAVFPEVLHARALDQAPPKCVIGDRGHNAGIVRTRIFARTSQLVCQDAPEGVEVRARLRRRVQHLLEVGAGNAENDMVEPHVGAVDAPAAEIPVEHAPGRLLQALDERARLRKNVEARPVLRIHELGLPRVEDQLDPFDACDFADGLVG